ncbi:MAG: hypothetical protein JO092_03375 [Candidatus Eremiobacteraeota bacterium]|nr:hypothetical protein [Candidatus Eremiobacteraeota bacterium]
MKWVCALLLAGCGLTGSPGDGLTFTAPYGWQASVGSLGTSEYWQSPSRSDERLFLIRSAGEQADLSNPPVSIYLGDPNMPSGIESREKIEICGDQAAVYLIGKGFRRSGSGEVESYTRVVYSSVNGHTYLAGYAYPVTSVPNGEALAALRQLCVKR